MVTPTSLPPAPAAVVSVSTILSFQESDLNEGMQRVPVGCWLFSLGIIPWRHSQVVVRIHSPSLFVAEERCTVSVHHAELNQPWLEDVWVVSGLRLLGIRLL